MIKFNEKLFIVLIFANTSFQQISRILNTKKKKLKNSKRETKKKSLFQYYSFKTQQKFGMKKIDNPEESFFFSWKTF